MTPPDPHNLSPRFTPQPSAVPPRLLPFHNPQSAIPNLPDSSFILHPSSFPSDASTPAATPAPADDLVLASPLAALMTRHIIRDGEVILLMLRPSLWFIPFVCLRFVAVALILMIAAQIFNEQLHWQARLYHEIGTLLITARLMLAVLQWLGRLYVLTDLRAIRMSTLFNVEIHDCPLRKVGRVRVIYTLKERLLRLGSIEIIPFDDAYPVTLWQTIPKPKHVHDLLTQAIRRAKQGMNA